MQFVLGIAVGAAALIFGIAAIIVVALRGIQH